MSAASKACSLVSLRAPDTSKVYQQLVKHVSKPVLESTTSSKDSSLVSLRAPDTSKACQILVKHVSKPVLESTTSYRLARPRFSLVSLRAKVLVGMRG